MNVPSPLAFVNIFSPGLNERSVANEVFHSAAFDFFRKELTRNFPDACRDVAGFQCHALSIGGWVQVVARYLAHSLLVWVIKFAIGPSIFYSLLRLRIASSLSGVSLLTRNQLGVSEWCSTVAPIWLRWRWWARFGEVVVTIWKKDADRALVADILSATQMIVWGVPSAELCSLRGAVTLIPPYSKMKTQVSDRFIVSFGLFDL